MASGLSEALILDWAIGNRFIAGFTLGAVKG